MPRPLREPRLETVDGVYKAIWYDPVAKRTRRYSLRTADRQEARRRFAAFLAESERIDQEAGRAALTVDAALDLYLQEHVYASRGDGSPLVVARERIEFCIANLRPHFGPMAVADIMPHHVRAGLGRGESYEHKRRSGEIGRPAGDGTIRRELGCLIAALRHNVQAKRLDAGMVPVIPLPDKPPARDRWLTMDEMARLLAEIPVESERSVGGAKGRLGRLYRFVMIAKNTAARRRSIESLMWSQVDFDLNRIHFLPPGARQTGKRRVSVPISRELRPILERAFAEKTGLYVLDHSGSIRKQFERAVERAGLEGVTAHTLRHTWATWAAQRRVPMFEIAGVLGDNMATVTQNYAHHHPDHLQAAVDFMEQESARAQNGS